MAISDRRGTRKRRHRARDVVQWRRLARRPWDGTNSLVGQARPLIALPLLLQYSRRAAETSGQQNEAHKI